ncbi:MAG: hypothetical protein CBC25_06010 [Pelagibacteraceae bacterium TMED65]|nr:DNA mismatch repair protein MutT [Rickettsiales bacterium]OUU51223.1 MAG: hypothetical protein CBC25_06010 [Pelagibacteraceae bacterium TMED65]
MYLNVVACILKKNEKILISSRPQNKIFSGFFEFPGGKINPNEFVIEALKREIYEELGVMIDLRSIFFLKSYHVIQRKKKIRLIFFLCLNWFGEIFSKELQEFKWISPLSLNEFKMLKSNDKIINYLLSRSFPTTY